MKNCQNLSTKSYQNPPNKTNLIINIDDIVKFYGKCYTVITLEKNIIHVQDMYGKKFHFTYNEIQKIIFDSSTQSTLISPDSKSYIDTLKDTLKDLNKKLNNPFFKLSNTQVTKSLVKRLNEQLNSLEKEDKYKQLALF